MIKVKNETSALINVLKNIIDQGTIVSTRGFEQKEILANLEIIKNPMERVILLHHRGNNIFALIAETLWVMAGRDDLEYLSKYLPRAIDFSDDGKTWRAAYGPRLRNWHGVDQFKGVSGRLLEDRNTKRAVMSIFDPEFDYSDSLDVPCNNWLHFMSRENKLNLDVAVRANDAIWGFGGINTFEWSMLLQCMSYWTNNEVGQMNWFTGTIHVYKRHYDRANKIIKNNQEKTLYDFNIKPLPFCTQLNDFDQLLTEIFDIEKMMTTTNTTNSLWTRIDQIKDPLLKSCTQMLFTYNIYLTEKDPKKIKKFVDLMPESDFKVAAIEYYSRKFSTHTLFNLTEIESNFFKYFWNEE